MSVCCVCLKDFPGEEAPILMMDPSGNPLVLCPKCAALVEAIAGTPDSPERREAIEALAEIDVDSPMVATELSRLVNHEDAPLDPDEGWEDEAEVAAEAIPEPPVVSAKGSPSRFYLYLALGCLGAALILLLLLKLLP